MQGAPQSVPPAQQSTHKGFAKNWRSPTKERALAAAPHNKPKAEVVWREDGCAGEGSKKRKREDENRDCVGGLRQAHRAVEKLVGWQTVGAELRRCLDTVLQENPHMLHVVKSLGAEPEHKDTDVRLVQSKLASLLKLKDIPRQSGVWSKLLQALVRASGDPDHHTATWPKEGAPLTITEEIPASGGVFPPVPDSEQESEAAKLDNWEELRGVDYNYKSYEEHREQADLLFRRELDAGFARASAKREELESEVGPLVPAAIGVVAKAKPGGGHKYRLVHDLRRNGVNAKIRVPERLVLPRLRDAMDDALTLLEHVRQPQEGVMWLSLDFIDASNSCQPGFVNVVFLQAKLTIAGFTTALFCLGLAQARVWCRLAALVARATQSLTASSESRLELFIDDPLIALRGYQLGCSSCTVAVAGTGPAAGVAKGLLGAKGSLDSQRRRKQPNSRSEHPCAEVARVEGDRPDSLGKILGAETSSAKIRVQDVLWAAGLIVQARPYVQMLYAALSVSKGVVYAKQLKHALTWLVALMEGFNHGFRWKVRAHVRHQICLEVLVDASPWGGGAVRLQQSHPEECLALTWTRRDESAISAVIGTAASQAQWEAYMALRALWKWLLPNMEGQVRIRGDAAGVLQSFVKRSSKSQLLSRVVREVTLHLALTHRSLEAIHLWSEDNEWADALSRLKDPRKAAVVPPELRHLPLHREGPVLWRLAPTPSVVQRVVSVVDAGHA